MELGENNLIYEDKGKIISTFDFSNDATDITEMEKGQISFTDGFEENIGDSGIEEIEMLKDVEVAHKEGLSIKEDTESEINKNLKEYIKICRELDLIQSWSDFENYHKLSYMK